MNKPYCDCLGCAVGGDCCAPAPALQADPYLEARFILIEEMFSQLLGFFPPQMAEALAIEYNSRRSAVIRENLPDSDLAKNLGPDWPVPIPKSPSLILVPRP